MKKLKVVLALIIAAIASVPTFACGDYGMFRLQEMDAAEFLTFQNVSIVTITGITAHPQDENHKFYTVNINEKFRGAEAGTELVIDGKDAWRMYNAEVGDKVLLFTSLEEGKLVAERRLTMVVPSEAQLQRRLATVDSAFRANTVLWYEEEAKEMEKIYNRFRNFGPKLADGTHKIKQNGKVLTKYTVENGELNGEFTEFDWNGKVAQKGQFVNGQRAGVWKFFSNGELYSEQDFGTPTLAAAVHIDCY